MPEPTGKTDTDRILRDMAETRLKTGTAQISSSYSLGPEALSLLHRLSSNPDTAGDALKLLHELQVHQVEIDLQNEVIKNDEHLLADELAYYRALYECAPAGYLLVDFDGRIVKANRVCAELFNVRQDELGGSHFNRHLAPASHNVFHGILERVRESKSRETAEVFTAGAGQRARPLRVMANLSPDERCALLVCSEVP